MCLPCSMAVRCGHLLSLWKSSQVENIPTCSDVSATPVGETESPTPNCTATFQFLLPYTIRFKQRLGLAGHCHRHRELPASQLACSGHLLRGGLVSTFTDGCWGGIHLRTLCLHGQQSGLGGQATSSAEATWMNEEIALAKY